MDIRHFAGLGVIPPNGVPISPFGENASAAACHSGITLAPIHARLFGDRLLAGPKDTQLDTRINPLT